MIEDFNHIINKLDLTELNTALHSMIREYTFLSSTCRTLRKSDHKLAIKQLSKIPNKWFKKENKLLSKSQDPTKKKNGKKKKKRKREGERLVCLEIEIAI